MKKIISLLLAALLISLSVLPAVAAEDAATSSYVPITGRSPIPIVAISGDGDPLYNKDGSRALYYKAILNNTNEADEDSKENIKESVLNVLEPFLVQGALTNNWDPYYEALQKEVSELLADSLLDNNGKATNGTSISQNNFAINEYNMHTDKKVNGTYGYSDYFFYYDWRLDPLETADKFNEYIKSVKQATNVEKVGILSRCLGTSVVMAYIAKYGMDDICGVGFNGGVVNGSEVLSEPISGKFKLDPSAIQRFLDDCKELGYFNIDSFITSSIDLLDKNGTFDIAAGVTKATVYNKLVEGVTSALALSTFFTWPCYWAGVCVDDYDNAINYVFGKEGSEKRTEYAGLIEKLENYNNVVRKNLPSLFKNIEQNGNICVISKYGYQIGPICESCDEIGDQFASVYRSSYGATTATVYGTLGDKYINRRINEGRGKYISPDKQIDATTCLFPDNTWFVKGSSHSNWTFFENSLIMAVVSADRQLTVDDFGYTQFVVCDNKTSVITPMTAENCNTYNWTADEKQDNPSTLFERIAAFFRSLMNWFKEATRFIKDKQAEKDTAA